MARDYLNIGSSPYDEICAQVGSQDYDGKSRKECQAYRNQLRRQFGQEPDGAKLTVKAFQHDFGSYREVVCYYDDNIRESIEYAFKLEGDGPATWDQEAKDELSGFYAKLPFEQWMKKVDATVSGMIGLGAYDLADKPYHDWYDAGMSPKDAATEVIQEEAAFMLD